MYTNGMQDEMSGFERKDLACSWFEVQWRASLRVRKHGEYINSACVYVHVPCQACAAAEATQSAALLSVWLDGFTDRAEMERPEGEIESDGETGKDFQPRLGIWGRESSKSMRPGGWHVQHFCLCFSDALTRMLTLTQGCSEVILAQLYFRFNTSKTLIYACTEFTLTLLRQPERGQCESVSQCRMRGYHENSNGGNPHGLIYIFKCRTVVELQWLNDLIDRVDLMDGCKQGQTEENGDEESAGQEKEGRVSWCWIGVQMIQRPSILGSNLNRFVCVLLFSSKDQLGL